MASNGKWTNPVPSQVDRGTGLALQSLTSYLGGWQDWSGSFDMNFVGAYTLGNAVKFFEYKLQGDMCDFRFSYAHGTTTNWPAEAVGIKMPFGPAATSTAAFSVGNAFATDASTGLTCTARIYMAGGAGANFFGGPSFQPAAAGACEGAWSQAAGATWPFYSGVGARTAWAAGDSFNGHGRYRVLA